MCRDASTIGCTHIFGLRNEGRVLRLLTLLSPYRRGIGETCLATGPPLTGTDAFLEGAIRFRDQSTLGTETGVATGGKCCTRCTSLWAHTVGTTGFIDLAARRTETGVAAVSSLKRFARVAAEGDRTAGTSLTPDTSGSTHSAMTTDTTTATVTTSPTRVMTNAAGDAENREGQETDGCYGLRGK